MPSRDRPSLKRATIGDVALLAGADIALVSKVVNQDPKLRIKDDTRARILQAIADLNYLPSRNARNLRLARTKIIGLVVPALTNPTWAAFATAIERAADSRDRTLIIGSEVPSNERTEQFIAMVANGFLDGLMIATPASPAILERAAGLNILFINQLTPEPTSSIVFDDASAIEMALDHLHGLGHRVIAHLAGPATLNATHRRAVAFRHSMERRGLDGGLIFEGELSPKAGEDLMETALRMAPEITAVVIANAVTAIGALRHCNALGIAVPRDLSMVSIHDNAVIASLFPALDAVALPIEVLAEAAVDRLLNPGLPPMKQVVSEGIVLKVRESSARPHRSKPG